jgi:hypothetical protein
MGASIAGIRMMPSQTLPFLTLDGRAATLICLAANLIDSVVICCGNALSTASWSRSGEIEPKTLVKFSAAIPREIGCFRLRGGWQAVIPYE